MARLQRMRDILGPLSMTSAFRCPEHPDERAKSIPGSHSEGKACDIRAFDGARRYAIIKAALEVGMVGIGVADTFVHVDGGHSHAPRPAVWKY